MKYCGQYCNIQVKLTHTHRLFTSLQKKTAQIRTGSCALYVLLKMQLYLTLYQTVLSYETKMKDQCTCCQHAGSASNHTGLLQGTRPPGKMGSDAAQISQFLWEGEAELAPCSLLSSPLHKQLLVRINHLVPASLPATLPSLPCPPELLYSFLSSFWFKPTISLLFPFLNFSCQQVLKCSTLFV